MLLPLAIHRWFSGYSRSCVSHTSNSPRISTSPSAVRNGLVTRRAARCSPAVPENTGSAALHLHLPTQNDGHEPQGIRLIEDRAFATITHFEHLHTDTVDIEA